MGYKQVFINTTSNKAKEIMRIKNDKLCNLSMHLCSNKGGVFISTLTFLKGKSLY